MRLHKGRIRKKIAVNAGTHGLPQEGTLGGPGTMYPEYRARLKELATQAVGSGSPDEVIKHKDETPQRPNPQENTDWKYLPQGSEGRKIALTAGMMAMRKPKIPHTLDFDLVRQAAAGLEDVEEATSYSVPSLKVGGKLMTCPAINKSAEPGSLMVRVSLEERDELIAADPEVYYVTDHYVNHPSVLVRLSKIRRDSLEGLLRMSWRFLNSRNKRGRGSPKVSHR